MSNLITRDVELILAKTNEVPVLNVGDIDSDITNINGYTLSKEQKQLYNDCTVNISQQLKQKWTVYLEVLYSLDHDYNVTNYQQQVRQIIEHL